MNSEKCSLIYSDSRSVVAKINARDEGGVETENGEKFPKGPEETAVFDGYIHYLEVSDDFNLYT